MIRGFIFDHSKRRNLKASTSDKEGRLKALTSGKEGRLKALTSGKEGRLKAFTLVELLVVITIIGILTGISIAAYGRVQRNARDGKRKADLTSIQNTLELYYSDYSQYPGGAGCVSSTGACCPCDPSGSDWAGGIVTALEPTYAKDLPADPKNDTSYYYSYDPVCNETSTICGGSVTCTGSCCEYELAARLENGTTFRVCSP